MLTQPAQHRQMQLGPHTCRLPIPQSSPTRHAAAEAQFLRQVFPGNTGLQNVQNSVQCRPVVYRAAPTALGRGRENWNQGFQHRP